jgi:hypothetical protein
VEVSTIHGDNPRRWIRKYRKFFKLHFTPVHQWVEIASLYLEGKAEVWFEGFLVGDHDLTN